MRAARPLTPTLSPEYGGEGAALLPLLPGGDRLGLLPLPLAGEGWGEGLTRRVVEQARPVLCVTSRLGLCGMYGQSLANEVPR
jgi:hypothetical protein